jgi:transposase
VVDAFVDALKLSGLGFKAVEPAATGRPSYHPSVLLKLYIYGYLNRVQSSRRLEREASRNLEVIWLLQRLAPDDKTIADFRKDNGPAIKKVCAKFVELCRQMGLLTKASVAIDGSKFKAVSTRDKNFTKGKVERRRQQLEESVARYLAQLDTADLQEPSEALAAKAAHLKEKLAKLAGEMQKLEAYEKQMLASPDQQISLTDPDARSMATSGRGSGVVGYNVQVAVDTEHHLIIAHEVTNSGTDRAQLANMGTQAKEALGVDKLEAVADRGYYSGEEIKACDDADIEVTLPKPMTSGMEAKGQFGKHDFVYLADDDAYRCPAGEVLSYHSATVDDGRAIRRYWTHACVTCPLKARCTTAKYRVISRWEHEHVMEAAQKRLDENPQAMRIRRETVEHPFGTLKMRMGATHFLMKRLPKVATEMALHVLAYNLTRVMNIIGVKPLIAAIRA